MVRVQSLRFVAAVMLACFAVGQAQAKDSEPASPNTAKAQSAPRKAKVDLRPDFEKRRLGVRQQGQRGACQVFAFVGVLEYQLSKPGKPVDLSEQFLMWATNDANEFDRVDVGVTFDYARKYGIDAYYATLSLAGAKRGAAKR